MIKFTVDTYGRLDCAVNNAALKPDNNTFEELDEAYWDRPQAVDLKGTALCMKYEIRQYMAGLTKAAAYKYGVKGIRINSVAPGAIRTPMLYAALESMGITKADIIPTMSLIGRLGEPRAALNSYKQAVDRVGFLF